MYHRQFLHISTVYATFLAELAQGNADAIDNFIGED